MYILSSSYEERKRTMRGKTQLAKWGNSYAVRIPRAVLAEAKVGEGEDLQITAEAGKISITPAKRRLTLKDLLTRVTSENLHKETDWGKAAGNEAW
jgi:antitoxin MazE